MTKKDSEEHEAKCMNSGICCHTPVQIGAESVVVEGMHCKFLEKKEKKFFCTVYEDRFEKMPTCHHANVAEKHGLLHVGCLYNRTGKGKVRYSKAKYDYWWPKIRDHILSNSCPPTIGVEAFLTELRTREPDKEWEAVIKEKGILFQEKGKPKQVVFWNNYITERLT